VVFQHFASRYPCPFLVSSIPLYVSPFQSRSTHRSSSTQFSIQYCFRYYRISFSLTSWAYLKGVDQKMILKYSLDKYDGKMWTEFFLIRDVNQMLAVVTIWY
jgi:hypothetical protein